MPKRRVDGYGIATDKISGKVVDEHDTRVCVHCGGQFIVVPGSGTVRGFCLKCDGVLCGNPKCLANCLPFEKWLDIKERPLPKIFTG